MASLTYVAVNTRKAIRYFIYAIVALLVIRFLFGFGKGLYATLFPAAPPEPTLGFGVLPAIPFPDTQRPELEYNLQTPSGELPAFPRLVNIYYFNQPVLTHLNYTDTLNKARSLGFTSEPVELSETVYSFSHPEAPATLEINIVSNAFSVSYDFTADPTLLTKIPPPPQVAEDQARSFLSRSRLTPTDLSGPMVHQFLRIDGSRLVPAISLSEADFVKVNLFRKHYLAAAEYEIPSLTPNPNESNIWFIIAGDSMLSRGVTASQFHYFPIDSEIIETYPIKSAQEAFEELKAGGGFVANAGRNSNSVVIRDVYLAYYDPNVYTEFFQPIIVFEGDNDFTAYVPAVVTDYYGE